MESRLVLAFAACVSIGACGSGKDGDAVTTKGATTMATAPAAPRDATGPRVDERPLVRRDVVTVASSVPIQAMRVEWAFGNSGLSRMVADAIASVPRQYHVETFRLVACRSAEMDPVRASRERARLIREAGVDAVKGVRAAC